MKANAFIDSYRNNDFFECDLPICFSMFYGKLSSVLENVVISSNSWCKLKEMILNFVF